MRAESSQTRLTNIATLSYYHWSDRSSVNIIGRPIKVRVKWGALHNFKCVDYFQVEYHQVKNLSKPNTIFMANLMFILRYFNQDVPMHFNTRNEISERWPWKHPNHDPKDWQIQEVSPLYWQLLDCLFSDTMTLTWIPAPSMWSRFKPLRIIRFNIIQEEGIQNVEIVKCNNGNHNLQCSGSTGRFQSGLTGGAS